MCIYIYYIYFLEFSLNENVKRRKRRYIENMMNENSLNHRTYNRYTQTIQEYHEVSKRSVTILDDPIFSKLPENRTILFDCYDAEKSLCVQARFSIVNFVVGHSPIVVELKFSVDLSRIGNLENNLNLNTKITIIHFICF